MSETAARFYRFTVPGLRGFAATGPAIAAICGHVLLRGVNW
ncbi:hypothetical protein [Novosphingobium silvae]|nr:hypothetical protein [Novosphingobium silvae]